MKILNFGSLNLDYVYSVEHFVMAGETISSSSRDTFCGGKGLNQSVAAAKAGGNVFHAGNIGAEGGMLRDMLESAGVDTHLTKEVGVPTGHAIIQVNEKGNNCIILYIYTFRFIITLSNRHSLAIVFVILSNTATGTRMAKDTNLQIMETPSNNIRIYIKCSHW